MGPLYALFLVHDLQRVISSSKATLLQMILGSIWMSDTSYETNRIKNLWGKRGVFTWAKLYRGIPSPGIVGLEKSPWKQNSPSLSLRCLGQVQDVCGTRKCRVLDTCVECDAGLDASGNRAKKGTNGPCSGAGDSARSRRSACENGTKEEANKSLFLWAGGFLLTNGGCGSGGSGFTAPLCRADMSITLLGLVTQSLLIP